MGLSDIDKPQSRLGGEDVHPRMGGGGGGGGEGDTGLRHSQRIENSEIELITIGTVCKNAYPHLALSWTMLIFWGKIVAMFSIF